MNKQTSIQRALSLRKNLSARKKQSGSAKKRILIILLILLAAAMLLLPVIMWLSHVLQEKSNACSNDIFGPGTEADIDDLKARHVQRLDVLKNEYDGRAGKATMEDGPINNRFFDNGDNDE